MQSGETKIPGHGSQTASLACAHGEAGLCARASLGKTSRFCEANRFTSKRALHVKSGRGTKF
jgi:hypothetical protein